MDLVADLGWLGYEGCLLEYSVVFDLNLVLLDEDGVVFAGDGCLLGVGGERSVDLAGDLFLLDVDDVFFAGDGVKDSPLCLYDLDIGIFNCWGHN